MDTWEPDDHPQLQPLTTHMRHKVKRKIDGDVDRFRSSMVQAGHFQIPGDNCLETYASVISVELAHIFL